MITNVFGLIGFPLTHSFSKKFFDEKFLKQNIQNTAFNLYSIESINQLSAIITIPFLKGLAVTIPYKKQIIPFLNEMDDAVKILGACNCITVTNGQLKGYNTDVIGFKKSLLQHLTNHHTKALVLGTGGAAAAVEFVLQQLNIDYLNVSRNGIGDNILSYNSLTKKIVEEHTLIVNTTPLGTFPDINQCPPIPYEFIGSNHLLFDLVYNPTTTMFMQKGMNHKAKTVNGYDMLVYQAEENWKIWNSN